MFKGMNLVQIGVIEGIFHATSMIVEIPSGAVADLLGRKNTVIAGRLCMVMSYLLMLRGDSFVDFSLAFCVQALGYNLNSGAEEALVYDSMKLVGQEDRYLRISGRINVVVEIAQGISMVIGGALAEYSFEWCYLSALVFTVLSLLPAIWFQEPERETRQRKETKISVRDHFAKSYDILRGSGAVRATVLYYSIAFAFYTTMFYYCQTYLTDLGLSKIELSLVMLLVGIVSCGGAISSEKVYAIIGEKTKYVAAVMIAGALVGMWFEYLWLAIGLLLIASYASALLYPIQSNALNRLIPSEQRATLLSVNSMVFSIIMVIFFPLTGVIAEIFRVGVVLPLLGVVQLIVVVIAIRISRSRVTREESK